MSLLASIKDHHSERRLFLARVIFAAVVASILLGIVVARLVQLQVFDYEHFAERAQGNRIRIEAVPPIRGLILDRKGRVLAENQPAYQLELVPEQVDDIDDTLTRLAALDLIDAEDIPRILSLTKRGPRFKPVTLKLRMTDKEVAHFAIQRPRFPGVDFRPRLIRHYPDGPTVAHAVGYVGALSERDLQTLDPARYSATGQTGKTGIEYSFESKLHGDPGYRHVVTNARGRVIAADTSEVSGSLPADAQPVPGMNVYLSLDLDLQKIAYESLLGQRGAVVAIDPWSGEILALVSSPSFDPNLFAAGLSQAQFTALQNDLDQPLFDRGVRGTYPPGSTIKPMLALAALETGATNLTRKQLCIGYFTLPNTTHRYRDWKPQGHGKVDLHDALEQSCDVYFYEISVDLGIDRMHEYLDQFGLGRLSGIDVPGEKAGINPSREWKEKAFSNPANQRWFHGETVIASIGQGYMLTTPLQLASATATLATRGSRFKPHLVAAWEDPLTGERTLVQPERIADVAISNEFYWENVIEAMHDVMQGTRGTARAVGTGAPYTMAGKSGTAQVFSVAQEEKYDEDTIAERLRDHALFIAFAPVDNPQIAVAVIVENGSSGSRVAAPIARAVMDKYLGVDDAAK
ncbi:MAG TPA: penicillin-binding protein 2 [Woeseiaceae bacterium]|nr:penicillin-binding protein 2 [Woeseiaceae bacterium]